MVNNQKPNSKKNKGQSTLEYIVLVTGVVAVLLIFLNPTNGVFRNAFDNTLTEGTDGMVNMAERLRDSRGTQPVGD